MLPRRAQARTSQHARKPLSESPVRFASQNSLHMAALGALFLLATAVQWNQFQVPLLEGAAGKQAHMAMVARNFASGTGTFLRPRVDDVGNPGYFVKELPLVPWIVSLTGENSAQDTARRGRWTGWFGWLAAAFATSRLAMLTTSATGGVLTAAWMLLAPLALAYGPAFQNDQWAVAASVAALLAILGWRRQPSMRRALACIPWLSVALLLKPHVAFWLAPAAITVLTARGSHGRPAGRAIAAMVSCGLVAGAIALPWYVHAMAVHRDYPVPGATVSEGWINLRLLLEPFFWTELARQVGWMVLTPLGAGLAALGLSATRDESRVVDAALFAWAGGVVLQDGLLATRLFDSLSRGTEYYQLPLLVPAAIFVARGSLRIAGRLQVAPAWSRGVALGALAVAVLASSFRIAENARQVPARYEELVANCAEVERATDPRGSFVVFGDRGGTILYYCERRGITYALAGGQEARVEVGSAPKVSNEDLNESLAAAEYVYFPYPELLTDRSLLAHFETWWDPVRAVDSSIILFRKRYGQ